jgi:hypothetical protein
MTFAESESKMSVYAVLAAQRLLLMAKSSMVRRPKRRERKEKKKINLFSSNPDE